MAGVLGISSGGVTQVILALGIVDGVVDALAPDCWSFPRHPESEPHELPDLSCLLVCFHLDEPSERWELSSHFGFFHLDELSQSFHSSFTRFRLLQSLLSCSASCHLSLFCHEFQSASASFPFQLSFPQSCQPMAYFALARELCPEFTRGSH